MKTNKVQVTVAVPVEYKWMATQPWGDVEAFVKKPVIYKNEEGEPDYWYRANDDKNVGLILAPEWMSAWGPEREYLMPCSNWRDTLKRIGGES
jgi:hypothetical protein